MSELTNWLDKMADECDRECRVSGSAVDLQKDQFKAQAHAIAARINWHLRAHDAETREKAMREQMEQDCRAVCATCAVPPDLRNVESDAPFELVRHKCEAIRDAYDKAKQERKGGNHA